MNTTTRLAELKRDLAELEDKRGPTRRSGNGGQHARGRDADHPGQIPARGWKDILWRAWGEVSEANLFLIAGGVTYAILLALFPGLAALVSLYGLVLDASQIERHIGALSGVLPTQTLELLSDQLHKLVEASGSALGVGAAVGLVLALWSASRGMSGTITALNIAYEEKERRGFLKLNFLALGLTLGMMAGGVVVIALVAVLPAAVQFLDLGGATKWLLLVVQWPLLIVLVMLGLAVLYRYAPDKAQWRYDKTYGSLGGVIILLTWAYLSALMVLFGAVINAQSEKQTRQDSTDGSPAPMGTRGARAADSLGRTRQS